MKNIIIALLLISGATITLNAQTSGTNFKDLIYSVRPDDQRFLRYIYISNNMGTSYVDYRCGEFILQKSNNTRQRVHLANALKIRQTVRCDSTHGISTNVYPYTRTTAFIVPPDGGSLHYYRTLGLMIGSNETDDITPTWNHEDTLYYAEKQRWWALAAGTVLDRMEFVIEIYNANTNIKCGSFDSIGIMPNNTSKYAIPYGNGNSDPFMHSFTLPSHLYGDTIYLQISPRRWGPTPFGMPVTMEQRVCNLSGLPHETHHWDMPGTLGDSIYYENHRRIYHYCDSMIAATCSFPLGIPGSALFHPAQRPLWHLNDEYYNKYYINLDTLPSGAITRRLKDFCSQKTAPSMKPDWMLFKKVQKDITVENTYPHPSKVNTIYTISLDCKYAISHVRANIYSIGGKYITTLWQGKLDIGKNIISMNNESLQPGTYTMVFENALDEVFGVNRFIVTE